MTDTSVTSDIHKTLDVQLSCGTELALNLILVCNRLSYCSNLVICPILHLDVAVDAVLIKDFLGRRATNSEDIGKTYLSPFVFWQSITGSSPD